MKYKDVLNTGLIKEAAPRWVKMINTLASQGKKDIVKSIYNQLERSPDIMKSITKRFLGKPPAVKINEKDFIFGGKEFGAIDRYKRSGQSFFMSGIFDIAKQYGDVYALPRKGLRHIGAPAFFTWKLGVADPLLRRKQQLELFNSLQMQRGKLWEDLRQAKNTKNLSMYSKLKAQLKMALQNTRKYRKYEIVIDNTSDKKTLNSLYKVWRASDGTLNAQRSVKNKLAQSLWSVF